MATPASTLFFGVSLTAENVDDQEEPISVGHRLGPDQLPDSLLQVLLEALNEEAQGGGVLWESP